MIGINSLTGGFLEVSGDVPEMFGTHDYLRKRRLKVIIPSGNPCMGNII